MNSSKSQRRPATATKSTGRAADQNVKSHACRPTKKQGLRPAPKLARTTFRTSREMDFFSERELVTQTGHEIQDWPLVFLKETIDNALGRLRGGRHCPDDRRHGRRQRNHGSR